MYSFNIDEWLNPLVPAPRFERWPVFISHFFGYRPPHSSHPGPIHDWALWAWILFASFSGMVVVMLPFRFAGEFIRRTVPVVMPSIGASAVLVYNTIDTPLAQPRNVFFGTFLSSLVGVCIEKLFMTNPANERYLWVGGALSVGVASALMRITGCVHPPAGAAALMPSVVPQVRAIGWYYLPVQLLSTVLLIAVAALLNNIQRRYPMYWWTPVTLGVCEEDEEQAPAKPEQEKPGPPVRRRSSVGKIEGDARPIVVVTRDGVDIYRELDLSPEQIATLEQIQQMLLEAEP